MMMRGFNMLLGLVGLLLLVAPAATATEGASCGGFFHCFLANLEFAIPGEEVPLAGLLLVLEDGQCGGFNVSRISSHKSNATRAQVGVEGVTATCTFDYTLYNDKDKDKVLATGLLTAGAEDSSALTTGMVFYQRNFQNGLMEPHRVVISGCESSLAFAVTADGNGIAQKILEGALDEVVPVLNALVNNELCPVLSSALITPLSNSVGDITDALQKVIPSYIDPPPSHPDGVKLVKFREMPIWETLNDLVAAQIDSGCMKGLVDALLRRTSGSLVVPVEDVVVNTTLLNGTELTIELMDLEVDGLDSLHEIKVDAPHWSEHSLRAIVMFKKLSFTATVKAKVGDVAEVTSVVVPLLKPRMDVTLYAPLKKGCLEALRLGQVFGSFCVADCFTNLQVSGLFLNSTADEVKIDTTANDEIDSALAVVLNTYLLGFSEFLGVGVSGVFNDMIRPALNESLTQFLNNSGPCRTVEEVFDSVGVSMDQQVDWNASALVQVGQQLINDVLGHEGIDDILHSCAHPVTFSMGNETNATTITIVKMPVSAIDVLQVGPDDPITLYNSLEFGNDISGSTAPIKIEVNNGTHVKTIKLHDLYMLFSLHAHINQRRLWFLPLSQATNPFCLSSTLDDPALLTTTNASVWLDDSESWEGVHMLLRALQKEEWSSSAAVETLVASVLHLGDRERGYTAGLTRMGLIKGLQSVDYLIEEVLTLMQGDTLAVGQCDQYPGHHFWEDLDYCWRILMSTVFVLFWVTTLLLLARERKRAAHAAPAADSKVLQRMSGMDVTQDDGRSAFAKSHTLLSACVLVWAALTWALFIWANSVPGVSVFVKGWNPETGEVVATNALFSFTLLGSVQNFLEAKTYVLGFMVGTWSGLVPYAKLMCVMYLWMAPRSLCGTQRKQALAWWLDILGKWSFIDVTVTVFMAEGMFFELGPFGDERVFMVVEPEFGIYSFVVATISSMVLTHLVLHIFEREHAKDKLVTPAGKDCTGLGTAVGVLSVCVCVAGLVYGVLGTSIVEFELEGALGAILSPNNVQYKTTWDVLLDIPASQGGIPGSDTWALRVLLQGLMFAGVLVVPLLLCVLNLLVVVSSNARSWKWVRQMHHTLLAWNCMEVYLFTVFACQLELTQLAQMIMGDKCDALNKILVLWTKLDSCLVFHSYVAIGMVPLGLATLLLYTLSACVEKTFFRTSEHAISKEQRRSSEQYIYASDYPSARDAQSLGDANVSLLHGRLSHAGNFDASKTHDLGGAADWPWILHALHKTKLIKD
jgi:hypothetical protein